MSAMNQINMTTPCCNAPFWIDMRHEGGWSGSQDVPEDLNCEGEGCRNTWSPTGVASPMNRYPGEEY